MRVLITQGDERGVGPEIVIKALDAYAAPPDVELSVLGDSGLLAETARRLGIAPPKRVQQVAGSCTALSALETAAAMLRKGDAAAVVTAPVHKARLRAAGFDFPGQTEFFAARLDAPDHAMMLTSGSLRVVPLTTHTALRLVPDAVDAGRIRERTRTIRRALRDDFGIGEPRIAVLGLNPHAGEDGHFGREEIEIIGPAVEALRAEGILAEGPVPADAAFLPRRRESYDAILGMYHDQVLGPFKALASVGGVNVTIGLPAVRTSPDHGTADDIAGQGVADPSSMLEAIRLAVEMAGRRRRLSGLL